MISVGVARRGQNLGQPPSFHLACHPAGRRKRKHRLRMISAGELGKSDITGYTEFSLPGRPVSCLGNSQPLPANTVDGFF